MAHLPTICDGCSRVTLTPFSGPDASTHDCPGCGGTMRVVPSCSFNEADVQLFDELSEAVADGLDPVDAQRLAIELSRALWAGTAADIFEGLAARWANLMPLALVTGTNQAHQRRVLLMLKSIFEAVSVSRRSGTVATATGEGLTERRRGPRQRQ